MPERKNQSIFIITRYSIISGGIKMTAGLDIEEQKRKVFDATRLENRFSVFSSITAESLKAQKECEANLFFIILIADELPFDHVIRLERKLAEIEASSSFKCLMVKVPALKNPRAYIDGAIRGALEAYDDHPFATVRLDDDDALAASYCATLTVYLQRRIIGFPISFAWGFEGYFDHKTGLTRDLRHWYYPKIALGLAFTNLFSNGSFYDKKVSIYSLGSHTKVDVNYPLIIDTVAPMYLRTVNGENDSGGYIYHAQLPKVEEGELPAGEFSYISVNLPEKTRHDQTFSPQNASSSSAKHRAVVRDLNKEINDLKKKSSSFLGL